MIFIIFLLNLAVSAFNAWACGRTWIETRALGGWQHFMNWMGAVMSASGFTWCYTVLLGVLAHAIPVEVGEGSGVYEPLLSAAALNAYFSLGYLVIILPVIGSGLAIMLESWAHFWRKRTFGSGAVAGWNTFANAYNVYQAASGVPRAFDHVKSFLKEGDRKIGLVILLVVLALGGGILTTTAIIRTTMRRTAAVRAQG